jgi:ABC-type dipeptide/oligopeptide/nickel transport system ATPase component
MRHHTTVGFRRSDAVRPASTPGRSLQPPHLGYRNQRRDMLRFAYIFIAHDLPVLRHFTDRVMVMLEGKIVEQGPTEEIFARPSHPYTQRLLAASPVPDPDVQRRRHAAVLPAGSA